MKEINKVILTKLKSNSMSVSNTGKYLVLCYSSKCIVYSFPELEVLEKIDEVKYGCKYAFSSDDSILAVKSTLGKIYVYNLISREMIFIVKAQRNAGGGSNILFTPDNDYIIDGDFNGNLRTISLKNGDVNILEKKRNEMREFIQFNSIDSSYHIQNYYRGTLGTLSDIDKTYVSIWRYSIKEKRFSKSFESNKRRNSMPKLLLNEKVNKYLTIYKSKNSLTKANINEYDNTLEDFELRVEFDNKKNNLDFKPYLFNDLDIYIIKLDNEIRVYDLTDYHLLAICEIKNWVSEISISKEKRLIVFTDWCLKGNTYISDVHMYDINTFINLYKV